MTGSIRVAILGNPNTGKSTLFNALTGLNVRTGNYPGVTVEKRIGKAIVGDQRLELVDLPGAYSLSPQARDELVAVEVVLGMLPGEPAPDVVLCIVSAENLERHLFLVSQALDLGLPVVLALNMWDSAQARGVKIDVDGLAASLGIPVIPTEAHRRRGVKQVCEALIQAAHQAAAPSPSPLPAPFYDAIQRLALRLEQNSTPLPRFFIERAILDVEGPIEQEYKRRVGDAEYKELISVREQLRDLQFPVERIESRERYRWIREHCLKFVEKPEIRPRTWTDRLDRWLTHRVFGFAVFLLVMFVVFQAIFHWSAPMMDALETLQQYAAGWVEATIPPGALQSMLVDSVVAGTGTILLFLPQIALLFLFIAILEDCGYLPRVAFMMDRLMSSIGLNGKSFIPLMSSFACAVPGVMAARVIENPRDRLVTILVAPLMSCSARLPVYLLLIGAFIPQTAVLGGTVSLRGLVLFAMSSLGAVIAIPIAWTFRRTLLKGDQTPFVLELPEYKLPSARVVLNRVYDRSKAFVVRAGTLILASSVLVWAAGYFPGDRSELIDLQSRLAQLSQDEVVVTEVAQTATDTSQQTNDSSEGPQITTGAPTPVTAEIQQAELTAEINAESARLLEVSFLGRAGKLIEPLVKPLGWDWRIGVSAIASFPAREVVISTLGTIYSLGAEVDEADEGLIGSMHKSKWPDGTPVYNIPVALSIMVFFALCAQCASTLLIIRRETNSWRWPLVCFVYMTTLAYVGALITYQVGRLFLAG